LAIQKEITRQSKTTVRVPAAGPYSSTAVKTNASEIEIETCAQGSLTEAEPLISVSSARRNHCGCNGDPSKRKRDSATARVPRSEMTRR
jgi:hypothetical protein